MVHVERITHTIPPVYDDCSRVLVLGSMPSPKSRETGFYYGHPQNRFWRVMAALADEPVPNTNERKRDFCLRHHIALWDVLAACDIEGASDASIANAVPNPLARITNASPIEAVFCTGAKSHALYERLCSADVGMHAVKLPSTSPANAAWSLQDLLVAYAAVFEHTHPYEPPTLGVDRVVALEQAVAAAGTSLSELMDRAGAAVAWRVEALLAQAAVGKRPSYAAVLCGNGNNGGDGWVAARLLAERGVPVCVLAAKTPEQITAQPARDAALAALRVLSDAGAQIVQAHEKVPFDEAGCLASTPLVLFDDGLDADGGAACAAIERASVVVDAITGTGASSRPLRQPFAAWVTASNRSRDHHVSVAVDIPSGVNAETGDAVTPCFAADETITMMVRKPGLANPACGHVRVAPLAYIEPLL